MTRPSESRFLTAQQVADLFGVTKSTVNRWREDRRLTAHAIPSGQWRYPEHQPAIRDARRALRHP